MPEAAKLLLESIFAPKYYKKTHLWRISLGDCTIVAVSVVFHSTFVCPFDPEI